MGYIATFDIGTTALKGVLVSEEGNPVYAESIDIETIFNGDWREQRPEDWYREFVRISKNFTSKYSKSDIIAIVMSGQMQDVILLDKDNQAIDNAILYSDGRAEAEAHQILEKIGEETIFKYSGNDFNGSLPFAKLLWLKNNKPEQYQKASKVVFSSKDYIIAKLTNKTISDVTTCATTGLMDIHNKTWMTDWADAMDLDNDKLPDILYSYLIAGFVTEEKSLESGYEIGTPVFAGTGDAGATTLASGISQDGEFNINLGTSGWVACVSNHIISNPGVFNLAAMQRDLYINVVPFLNAGNVHKWISKTLTPDDLQDSKYEYTGKLLEESKTGSNGIMFLPYITGERFPVLDSKIRGSFIGITPETTKQDLARATLEGVAYSIRQGIDSIDSKPKKISLIGGGAKNKVWCQILADVLGHEVIVYNNSEYMPSVAVATAAMIGLGKRKDYNNINNMDTILSYEPNKHAVAYYNQTYDQYCRIYPAIKDLSQ